MKILVVEDSPQVAETVMDYLELAGHRVDCAYHGQAALQLLAEQRFDVIIMDVMMPVMDGLEATKAIRMLEREDAKKIPIIAMTANAFEEDRKACLEAGMNEHIGKPIDIPRLKRAITKLLTKKG